VKPTIRPVAEFSVAYLQFLDMHGKPTQTLPDFVKDHTQLLNYYEMMQLTRVFDTKAIALQRTGRLGTYPSSLGQEAIAVAIGAALHQSDVFCGYYREYGAHLQRGVKMEEILRFWGGDERGSCFENCPEDFPQCVPIASQCLHAAGVATAMKLRKQKRCALAAVGEGGTSKGDFYETINLAGVWQLPLIVVVNNNQWAISVPREKQTATKTIAQKAIAGGVRCMQVDGNDLIALKYALDDAVAFAHAGKGPSLIEAITYRLPDHTTADDASRYRNKEEVEMALEKEPIRRLRAYLQDQNLWDNQKEQEMLARLKEKVEAAVAIYEKTPPQKPESMFDSLYKTLPRAYQSQRAEVAALGGKGEAHA
jgi:pyruvate dehydrogenase E1 component alpha subunit